MTAQLVRWSGLAASLGGILWILVIAITAAQPEGSRRGPEGLLSVLLLSLILMALGVVGIYVRQRARAGRLGTIAALVAGVGIAIVVLGRVAVDAGLVPAYVFAAGFLILLGGLLLFILSILRANVLPRSVTLMLVLGTLSLALFNFGDERIWIGVLFGAAWIWAGYALWAERAPPHR